jgi:hypothetical protein
MQHDELPPSLLDHMDALWSSLGLDDKRALRECSTATRDAVDAHASGLEGQGNAPVLSHVTCSRLAVTALTLRSLACLRGMVPPQPGAFFPRLQSLRLILHEEVRARHGQPRDMGSRATCAWGACCKP